MELPTPGCQHAPGRLAIVAVLTAGIHKDQLSGAQTGLHLAPRDPGLGDVRTILLGRSERLFLNVCLSRTNVRCIRPVLADTLCVADSHARNSAIVASGTEATCAAIASCRSASFRGN